jgi:DNA-directed RNA polymerase subunit RPC12/RpoP
MEFEFKCPGCGSPAIEYPEILNDDADVRCLYCKSIICSLSEFRRAARTQTALLGKCGIKAAPLPGKGR